MLTPVLVTHSVKCYCLLVPNISDASWRNVNKYDFDFQGNWKTLKP